MMKKKLALIVLFTLVIGIWTSAYAEQKFVSIQDVRATVPDRWTETYETKWRTVKIDVPIDVPAVDLMPIVRVKRKDALDSEFSSKHSLIEEYNYHGAFSALTSHERKSWYNKNLNVACKYEGCFKNGAIPDITPEGNTLTYEQALQLAEDILKQLEIDSGREFSLKEVEVFSGLYASNIVNGRSTFGEHLYGNGSWDFTFKQIFCGVDMERAVNCYQRTFLGNEVNFVSPDVYLVIYSAEDYEVSFALCDVIDKPYSDVPICSFEYAKKKLESEILNGHLRTLEKCKLCYIPYFDKKDKNIFWLIPAWYVSGGYTRSASKEFQPNYDEDLYVDDGMEHYRLVVNANNGELIEYTDNGKNRRLVPSINTWETVKNK